MGIYVLERQHDREIFHLLFSSPQGQKWLELVLTKARSPELKSSFQGSHVGGGAPNTGSSSVAFPGILAGSWTRSGAAGMGTCLHMGCWRQKRRLEPLQPRLQVTFLTWV